MDMVALITGGARGQGEAEARQFVSEGARVIITDVLDAEGTALATELGDAAVYRHHDVTDEAGWAATVDDVIKRWGRLDVLVNNAGINKQGPIDAVTEEDWDEIMAVNLKGPF